MDFERQIKRLQVEADDARQSLQALETANKNLTATIEEKETALMGVPRLEEEYLRSARKLVVKKERVVQQKTLAMKKMEGDVSKAVFWQQKAMLLGEENLALKRELADFKRNNIQAVTKLQWELQQEASKNQPHNTHMHKRAARTTSSAVSPAKKSTVHAAFSTHAAKTGHKSKTELNGGPEICEDEHTRQFQEAEMARLRKVIDGLREHNLSLTLKLADARAYPLLNLRPEPDKDDLYGGKNDLESELEALFHPDNEDEEDNYGDSHETRAERGGTGG